MLLDKNVSNKTSASRGDENKRFQGQINRECFWHKKVSRVFASIFSSQFERIRTQIKPIYKERFQQSNFLKY
jgi:hypothetical protein